MKTKPKFGTPEWDAALAEELAANLNRNVLKEQPLPPEPLTGEERARRRAEVEAHEKARREREK
jgi:hypothetical protein